MSTNDINCITQFLKDCKCIKNISDKFDNFTLENNLKTTKLLVDFYNTTHNQDLKNILLLYLKTQRDVIDLAINNSENQEDIEHQEDLIYQTLEIFQIINGC